MPGTVYWITGLSGAGKTIIGRSLYERLKKLKPNVVFLDGDSLRKVLGNETDFSLAARKQLALSYSRLCGLLAGQDIDVVCATISLFREVHDYNRKNIPNYLEIYIECSMPELVRRDQKGIYSKAIRREDNQVMGLDLPYDKPAACDFIVDNTVQDRLDAKVDSILEFAKQKRSLDKAGV